MTQAQTDWTTDSTLIELLSSPQVLVTIVAIVAVLAVALTQIVTVWSLNGTSYSLSRRTLNSDTRIKSVPPQEKGDTQD